MNKRIQNMMHQHPTHIVSSLRDVIDEVKTRLNSGGTKKLSGIETGFDDIDTITSGMRPRSLIVIAGRPEMGQSILSQNIASHVALNLGLPVVIFTMGASPMILSYQLLSRFTGIELYKLRHGDIDECGFNQIDAAMKVLGEMPLFIDETPSITVDYIDSQIKFFLEKNGKLGLVVIGDLQLIESLDSDDATSSDYHNVMTSLKKLARETNTPIVITSRINCVVEERKNKRPCIKDLPDRVIGQQSDLLMLLHRDEYFDPDSDYKGKLEISIGRHRYGSTGTILLGTAKLKFGEFSNLETIDG